MDYKKLASVCMAVLLSCTAVSFAQTDKEKRSELQADIKEKRDERNAVYKKIRESNATLADLDQRMTEAQQKLNKLQGEMKNLNTNIKATKSQIEEAQKVIDENDALLDQRIRIMYKTSDITYFQLLLESESIPDLISNIYNVQTIVNSDIEILEELEQKRTELKEYEEKLLKEKDRMTQVQNTIKAETSSLAQHAEQQKKVKSALAMEEAIISNDLKRLQVEDSALQQKILAAQRKSGSANTPYQGGTMRWPLDIRGTLTSGYSNRTSPITGRYEFHMGQDIAAPAGTPVYAANGGTVITSQYQRSYGNVVVIDHGGGISTVYAHNSSLLVQAGQTVTRGQQISRVGSTGDSTGNHLHFEVRVNGKAVNPMQYFN